MWKRRRFKKSLSGIHIKIKSCLIIFILAVFALTIYFLKSGFFNIKVVDMEVKDIACVQINQLRDASELPGRNIFLIGLAKTVDNLKDKFICIKSITAAKRLPDKVKLQVLGRQPLAVFLNLKEKQASISALLQNTATPAAAQIQDSLVADDEGVIFTRNPDQPNTPKVYIYNLQTSAGEKINNDQIKNVLEILEKIKALGITVNSGFAGDDFLVVNAENLTPKIAFSLNGQINVQLASLQLILTEAKIDLRDTEFIDLRFDKPVIKSVPKKN